MQQSNESYVVALLFSGRSGTSMNININNTNLFSQSFLLSKLLSRTNVASGQTGMSAVSCGVHIGTAAIIIMKMAYRFFQRSRQIVVSMGKIGKRLCPYQMK